MGASNPYAAASPRGYQPPKKKSRKWLWIGLAVAALIIIGAVLGGVLGTQLNKNKSGTNSSGGSSSGGSGNTNGAGTGGQGGNGNSGNTGVPSLIANTGITTKTMTGANGEYYLAVATDTYMLPVYATGVCSELSYRHTQETH